ncbi:probable L-type lectin-domain containing receptor kinase S.5 [Argentina anserina]|uniref:probable L-type lectin-domain containing receptor kinase S.5 n=1 Tax=Argentina anserina TaxID=57926 RepID=UPI00217680CF|nr:probable L-type lectin-domain containing receptor kinase S.5 [Potentilla anserina]
MVNLFLSLLLLPAAAFSDAQTYDVDDNQFGPFNPTTDYDRFAVIQPATINLGALQITPDTANDNFTMANKSGRVLYNQSFVLWNSDVDSTSPGYVASFNTSFLINVYRLNNSDIDENSTIPGEGLAFIIAPNLTIPANSSGQYLGLTNVTTDGNAGNQLVAIELDTLKEGAFDPDSNHMGLNINSVKSNKTVPLSDYGIEIAPPGIVFYMVWIQYDGVSHNLSVFMANQTRNADETFTIRLRPTTPILTANLNLKDIVNQKSYFGFAASTGSYIQLNCVLRWNLSVEMLPDLEGGGDNDNVLKIALGVGAGVVLVLLCLIGVGYHMYKKRKARASDPNILGALKSLPGTPREFSYRELKKATNNFDNKHKLGQGGFGVVFRAVLAKENNLEVAVKMFSRDEVKGRDDFLAELTIINRLRHKHLVRLLGWCHKNGMLLIVYEYMPNGSLDDHIFSESENTTLGWSQRYKIVSGVASALHYLHNEYDQRVVHRDLKASNIMLDTHFNARLGDFGLARALDNEKTSYAEIEGIQGTMGYIAPECFHTGKATCESDVYGFGAVLLEVVCGQRPWTKIEGYQLLVDWVWSLHREGRLLEAVDERLGNDYVVEEAERLLLLGLACSHLIANERPKTQTIIQIISKSTPVLQIPPFKPSFVWPSMPEGVSSIANTVNSTSSWPAGMSASSDWSPHLDSRDSLDQYGGARIYSDSSSLV